MTGTTPTSVWAPPTTPTPCRGADAAKTHQLVVGCRPSCRRAWPRWVVPLPPRLRPESGMRTQEYERFVMQLYVPVTPTCREVARTGRQAATPSGAARARGDGEDRGSRHRPDAQREGAQVGQRRQAQHALRRDSPARWRTAPRHHHLDIPSVMDGERAEGASLTPERGRVVSAPPATARQCSTRHCIDAARAIGELASQQPHITKPTLKTSTTRRSSARCIALGRSYRRPAA